MSNWIGNIDFSWATQYRKTFSMGMTFEIDLYHADIVEGAINELNTATYLEF
jgi:hypothetical protein